MNMKKSAYGLLLLSSVCFGTDLIKTLGDIGAGGLPLYSITKAYTTNDTEGEYQFAKSFIANEATTFALKYTINEERPNGKKHSFPSAHTSTAFQSASYLHLRYGLENSYWAYGIATFVGYSRLEAREHHPIDVFTGALIGSLSSWLFVTSNNHVTSSYDPAYKQFSLSYNIPF